MAGCNGIVWVMRYADPALEISTESVMHRIRREGFYLSLISIHRMCYRFVENPIRGFARAAFSFVRNVFPSFLFLYFFPAFCPTVCRACIVACLPVRLPGCPVVRLPGIARFFVKDGGSGCSREGGEGGRRFFGIFWAAVRFSSGDGNVVFFCVRRVFFENRAVSCVSEYGMSPETIRLCQDVKIAAES